MKTLELVFSKIEFLSNLLAPISILLLCSFGLRTVLVLAGQTWVRTFAHTATLAVLPIITFVITKVISGDIALSLGMVGALSIVRFRNPVRSPLELSVYFRYHNGHLRLCFNELADCAGFGYRCRLWSLIPRVIGDNEFQKRKFLFHFVFGRTRRTDP